MNVAEAEKNFAKLVNKVYVEGISVDLERDDKVISVPRRNSPGRNPPQGSWRAACHYGAEHR